MDSDIGSFELCNCAYPEGCLTSGVNNVVLMCVNRVEKALSR